MFRKELLILSILAASVFAVVACVTSLAIRTVQHDGKLLAEDTLPGLVNAGEAISRMDENWFHCRSLLNMESAEARGVLVRKIINNSTQPFWNRYSESIHGEQDEKLFKEMENAREEFLKVRGEYFEIIQGDAGKDAVDFFETRVGPAFGNYRTFAVQIFLFNAKLGEQRAARILHLSAWTPYALAALSVMVLVIGGFVGFKATLGAFTN